MDEERIGKVKGAIAAKDDNGSLSEIEAHDQQRNGIEGQGPTTSKKTKSCKGCLYYSSTLKSDSRNPFCVGITRSLPHVPSYMDGISESESSKQVRNSTDFKYGCLGYSLYSDMKGQSKDVQDPQSEMPVCVGIEVLADRRVTTSDTVPAHVHNREDNHSSPQPQTQKPAHPVGDDFLKRFTRNADVVATGVAKNVRKLGNHLKASLDDILYPDRRRPK